jgi:hypothetical protein
MEKEKKSNKKLVIILICLLVIIIGVLVAFIYIQANKKTVEPPAQVEEVRPIEYEPIGVINNDEDKAAFEEQLQDGPPMFTTQFTQLWTFRNSKVASDDAIFGNYEENTVPMYGILTVNDVIVWKSKVLQPGDIIPAGNIKLSSTVEPGTYEALLINQLVKPDGTDGDKLYLKISLVVQN